MVPKNFAMAIYRIALMKTKADMQLKIEIKNTYCRDKLLHSIVIKQFGIKHYLTPLPSFSSYSKSGQT